MALFTLKLYEVKDLLAVLCLDGTVFQARGRSLLFVPTIERAASKAWVTVARIFEIWRVEVYAESSRHAGVENDRLGTL
jgi:hypothetical protein